jgi:hypothetical protein
MLTTKQDYKEDSVYCYVHHYRKDDTGNLLRKENKEKVLAFVVGIPVDDEERKWDSYYTYSIMPEFNSMDTLYAIVATTKRLSKQWRNNGEYDRCKK